MADHVKTWLIIVMDDGTRVFVRAGRVEQVQLPASFNDRRVATRVRGMQHRVPLEPHTVGVPRVGNGRRA